MKYIIDTDPGIDDAIAICMAVKNKLDIIGFTISSGNIEVSKIENNLKVIEDILNINVPIYKGSKINKCNGDGATFAHGKDGLGYAVYPINETRRIEKMTAEDFIIKSSKKYKDDLTIICLGALTNLAQALKKDNLITKRINKVIIMGASYNPHSKKEYKEFNFNVDIKSTNKVLSSPFKEIKIITHEVGVKSFIEKDYVLNLRNSDNFISRFVGNISEKYIDFSYEHYKTIGLGTPDPTTIASIIDPSIIEYIPASICVNDDGICEIEKKDVSNIFIAKSFNLEKFREIFKNTFN